MFHINKSRIISKPGYYCTCEFTHCQRQMINLSPIPAYFKYCNNTAALALIDDYNSVATPSPCQSCMETNKKKAYTNRIFSPRWPNGDSYKNGQIGMLGPWMWSSPVIIQQMLCNQHVKQSTMLIRGPKIQEGHKSLGSRARTFWASG